MLKHRYTFTEDGIRLPPSLMAERLTLDQLVGVRIPGGQPEIFERIYKETRLMKRGWFECESKNRFVDKFFEIVPVNKNDGK